MSTHILPAYETGFVSETCITCAIVFYVPKEYQLERRKDHKNFYCPNAHSMFYPQKNEAEQLREQLLQAQRDKAKVTEQLWAEQREKARLMKRITKGVCVCCKRSFVNLARHMKSKHPEVAN